MSFQLKDFLREAEKKQGSALPACPQAPGWVGPRGWPFHPGTKRVFGVDF